MQDLNDLAYFVHVIDHGGFAPAGRALGEPKSKLSRRVASLEDRLGVQLIQRSTRRFSVTEIGQIYYRHCKAMLVEANAAQEAIDLTRAEPCGTIRMTCPVALLRARVGPMLARFLVRYPRVELHLEATDRRVDPVGEALDLAIRVRPLPLEDSELVMKVLARDKRQCLVASPALIEQAQMPQVPADLTGLPSLGLGLPQGDFDWVLSGPDGAEARIKHRPRFITRDMSALTAAAVAGVGVVQLPHMMIRRELAQGLLVALLPDWAPRPETVHAVFPSHRGMLPSVRTLIDFLAEAFETEEDE
jgi:DNA-binding transcriptional LysR family regulator